MCCENSQGVWKLGNSDAHDVHSLVLNVFFIRIILEYRFRIEQYMSDMIPKGGGSLLYLATDSIL